MAFDFQVVFPTALVQLTSVRFAQGTPLTLDVMGEDFRALDEVLINDVESPSVIVLGKNRLLAQVPESQVRGFNLRSLSVVSRQLTITKKSLIKFRVSDQPSKVTGILRLVQLFLKVLLTTPGTDIFSRRTGGGALRNLGKSFGKSQGGSIVADFAVSVDTTSKQIVAVQGRDPAIRRDERLLSAKIISASFSLATSSLVVSIELTSQAGRAATANLVV